jgi:hypothetical protein
MEPLLEVVPQREGHERPAQRDESRRCERQVDRICELVAALAEPPAYRPVATDGAARAAALMAELL